MNRPPWLAIAFSVALLALLPAQGSTVLPLTLADLCSQATGIQRAKVLSAEPEWGVRLGHPAIVTRIKLDVSEVLAGEPVRELVVFGGRIETERMGLTGQPELQAGEDVLLFLHGEQTQSPYLGLWQGVYRFHPKGTYREDRAVLDVDRQGTVQFTRDNEPAFLVEDFLAEVRRLRLEAEQRRAAAEGLAEEEA